MKNIIYSIVLGSFLVACQGSQGEIGPRGDTGIKGNTGAAGMPGTQGPIGNTGPTGAPGPIGPTGPIGVTPSPTLLYTNWEPMDNWVATTATALGFPYTFKKRYNLTFLPDYQNLNVSYFSKLGSYLVTKPSGEPVGNLYLYHKFTISDNNEIVFNSQYDNGKINLEDDSSGWFTFENNKVVPVMDEVFICTFSKDHYKASDDLKGIITKMSPKVRFIFIPVGLPAKTGIHLEKIKTYQQLKEHFDIPN
jgi:Collagen triple helix repeat (20 copies)